MAIDPIAPYDMPRADELPENTAPWHPTPRRAVLLVHDMQRYFLQPYSRDEQPGRALIAHTSALVRTCQDLGVPVFYTAQPGGMSEQERGLLKDFWGPGMKTTPEDREIIDELAPRNGSTVFSKWRYSAFARNNLLPQLRSTGRDQLVLCGVYAHVGVMTTAIEAFSHDIETFVVADAVADFTPEHHRMALEYAASRCAVVLPTQAVLTALGHTTTVTLS
jgi:bifunctional isochorismate lyase/aryl carrier protein